MGKYAEAMGLDTDMSDEEVMQIIEDCNKKGIDYREFITKKGKKVKVDPQDDIRFTQEYYDTSLK